MVRALSRGSCRRRAGAWSGSAEAGAITFAKNTADDLAVEGRDIRTRAVGDATVREAVPGTDRRYPCAEHETRSFPTEPVIRL